MADSIREKISAWLRTTVNSVTGVTAIRPKRVDWTQEVTKDLTAVIRQKSCRIVCENGTDLVFEQAYKITVAVVDSDTASAAIDTRINAVMAGIIAALMADPSCGGYADSNGLLLGELINLADDPEEPPAGLSGESLLLTVHFSTLKTNLAAAGGV